MITKRSIIAVDIDDTLADSTESLRLLVNERTGANLTVDDYRSSGEYWGYYERVWRQHGLVDLKLDEFDSEMEIDQLHVPLLASAGFALKQLMDKYDVVFITSRNASWEKATLAWMNHYLGENQFKLFFTNRFADKGVKTKGQLCIELGATLLIDDNVDHCRSAIDNGVDAILFGEYGWQQSIPSGLKQCKDWPNVLEYVNGAK